MRDDVAHRRAPEAPPSDPLTFLSAVEFETLCGPAGPVAHLLEELQQMRAEALAALRAPGPPGPRFADAKHAG
jgi:hypothetical protein